MLDRYKREISYMRISLTDRCNFRCIYCMPESGIEKCSHDEIISLEEIVKIVEAASKFGIKKIRLTGGEPLVRRGIVSLCENLSKIDGIEEICITTNGVLFEDFAEDLKTAGVTRVNFSLDTLDKDKFIKITRGGDYDKTIRGIKKAIDLGFRIKINAVMIGGFNDDEIRDFVELTRDNDIQVRFIELMKLGETRTWDEEKFISNQVVLERIPELEAHGEQGVAKTYKFPGYKGTVGLISPISSCFCEDCNRIRLTSDGKLKPCLHSNTEVDLRGLSGEELEENIAGAIYNKPETHHLREGYTETERNMNAIGG